MYNFFFPFLFSSSSPGISFSLSVFLHLSTSLFTPGAKASPSSSPPSLSLFFLPAHCRQLEATTMYIRGPLRGLHTRECHLHRWAMCKIVSPARPLSLRASQSGMAPLQSLYPGERSAFLGRLLAPLSPEVTWHNLESLALGASLDSILLEPQFVQKCNKTQKLKVQLFRPLGKNLGLKLNLCER